MANRYWVGGAGTWNTSSTTNWSASSGGASGASVPTATDSVFFDQATTYTVTCTGALTCLDITVSAGTVTFATGTTPTFAISGSMSLVAATVWSATGAITFNATTTGKTVTTNGVSLSGAMVFNGVGGGWTLGSALTTTSSVTFTNGTFSTGNFACSSTIFQTATGTKTVTLGSSTINLSSAANAWSFSATNLTFTAGTSTININTIGGNFSGSTLTYNTVNFTSTSSSNNTLTANGIIGAATFANVTITAPTSGVKMLQLSNDITVTGTFTANGGSYNARTFILSSTNTVRTITAATVAIAYCDFQSTTGAGAGSWTGTSIGNCYGNSGITFTTAKTVYWNLAGTQNWSATGWATTSGGTPAAANFPLAQDTAIFNNTGSAGTITINAAWNIGTINMSARTSAMTLSTSSSDINIYGSWLNGTGTTISGTGISITFAGRTTQQLTSAGKTFTQTIAIDNVSGTVQCNDALTISVGLTFATGTLKLAAGTTSTMNSFSTTASTLKYLQSTTSGTQATISDASGTNTVTYLSIQDSAATGGATWDATSATNVNAGNNTGWLGFASASNADFFFMFN